MKTTLRWTLSVGLVLASGLTTLGKSVAATSSETGLTITIHVHNYAQVDQKMLTEAEEVTTGVFRKAGVKTRWVDTAATPATGQEISSSQGSVDLSHITLSILPASMAERLGRRGNVMGLAPGSGRDRFLVYVFYNVVEALGQTQAKARLEGSSYRQATPGQILGHAIAHEVGHLMLNMEIHSGNGIMRGGWNLKDLQDASYSCLLFTPQQAGVIRAEVLRRVHGPEGSEVVGIESANLTR